MKIKRRAKYGALYQGKSVYSQQSISTSEQAAIMTTFDQSVSFGKQKNIGGIRVNAVSHIPSVATISLSIRRGVKQHFQVHPIPLENNQQLTNKG